MASYRPFIPPPQSNFGAPSNQNPLPPPPPPPPQAQGNQYTQNWGYGGGDGSSYSQNYSQVHPNSSFQHGGYAPSSQYGPPSRNPIPPTHPQQQQYPYPPPPPPQESSYPPPPPPQESSYPPPLPPSMSQNSINLARPPAPAPMYYPSSQYSQFNHQQLQPLQPPPPPPSPPPSSSIPPPPPPQSPPPSSSVPNVDQNNKNRSDGEKGLKDITASGWGEPGHLNPGVASKQHKPPVPELSMKKSNGPLGRIETEEERRLRKKRELDKQRQEEKYRQQLKESQNTVLQKTQMLSSGMKGHGSISGSRMGERRTTPLLSGERIENRL